MSNVSVRKRKIWGIILLVWPIAAFVLSLVVYAASNFVFSGGGDGIARTIINVILFVVGAAAVGLGLPSIVVGIVLLATQGSKSQQQAASSAPSAKQQAAEGGGMAVAGMILGICSIVFAWFFGFILAILAIIFSAVALKRKTKKGMAIAGLVTGIVGAVLGFIVGIAVIMAAYSGIQQRANTSSVASDASTVTKYAEIYNAEHGSYPDLTTIRELITMRQMGDIKVSEQGIGGDIVYIPCNGEGAIIWYWDAEQDSYQEQVAGITSNCQFKE